jgi:hypothetical protein
LKNNNDDKITTGMFTLILSVAEQSVRHGLDFGKPMQLAGPGASGRRVITLLHFGERERASLQLLTLNNCVVV